MTSDVTRVELEAFLNENRANSPLVVFPSYCTKQIDLIFLRLWPNKLHQEPIKRSLHMHYILESTIARIFSVYRKKGS